CRSGIHVYHIYRRTSDRPFTGLCYTFNYRRMIKSKVDINYDEVVIDVRGVSKSFGDLHVLRGVDLKLYDRENLVVLGRSGTGKSVLIKLITGLLKPDAGEIDVLGQVVNQLNDRALRALRQRIGFSFQNSALY